MGPVSRAAVVQHQRAVESALGHIVDELQMIRVELQKQSGRTALDQETINERLERVETRVFDLERARST
jgi:siroheme synthase